jgi:hypothetical protein
MEEDGVNAVGKGKNKKKGKGKANNGHANAVDSRVVRSSRHQANVQLVQETGAHLRTMLGQRSDPKTTTSSSQECRQRTRTRQQARRAKDQQWARPEPAQRQCQRMLLRRLHRQQLKQRRSSRCKRTPEGFCKRRMVLAEDPFSHTYGSSSEFNGATFLTSFDRK